MPGLWRGGALSRLRHRPDASHKTGDQVLCHLCDYRTAPPTSCPACDSGEIRYWGLGTQKLEAEVRARFPNAPLLRMDADTMRARGAHEKALCRISRGQGPHPAGHADDRQGARFSQRDAGGRDPGRHGPAPARLPCGGTDLSPRDPGGRPDRSRGQGRPGAGADVQPRSPGDPCGGAARLCGLRGRGIALA